MLSWVAAPAVMVTVVDVAPVSPAAEKLKVGMQFTGQGAESGATLVYTVTNIADDKVVVDGNPPLAGRTLQFSCTVSGVRAATKEEIAHRHVHGPHGHGHSHGRGIVRPGSSCASVPQA